MSVSAGSSLNYLDYLISQFKNIIISLILPMIQTRNERLRLEGLRIVLSQQSF